MHGIYARGMCHLLMSVCLKGASHCRRMTVMAVCLKGASHCHRMTVMAVCGPFRCHPICWSYVHVLRDVGQGMEQAQVADVAS